MQDTIIHFVQKFEVVIIILLICFAGILRQHITLHNLLIVLKPLCIL